MATIEGAQPSARLGALMLPSGRSLPLAAWTRRHHGVLLLLGLHAVGLFAFALEVGAPLPHAAMEAGLIASLALAAGLPHLTRRARSVIAAIGLMSCSAILVHLSGGYIEAHFHFFVMLGVIFLYEDWLPYVLAVAYVALHHGIMGTLAPLEVYNHASAIAQPWRWAGIHAIFIFGLSAALIVAWNVIERARSSETRAQAEANELKRRLHTQEKMAALGSLVSGLAHEVRTPLTVVATSAGLLEIAAKRAPDDALSPRILAQTEAIRESVDRINALVLQLRRFHALAPEERRDLPLDEVVKDAVRLFRSAHKTGASVVAKLDATAPTHVHPLGVHQIVLNLLSNASEATDPHKGTITIETSHDATHAILRVTDTGTGMDEDTQRKAFDPLFTTKKDGMGLGLHIVKRIVDAHDGEIRCGSKPGAGTTFEVLFPLARKAVDIPVDLEPLAAPEPKAAPL